MSTATSKILRTLVISALLLSGLTVCLLVGSYALLTSKAGTTWLAGQLQARMGETVSWESLEGTLASPLTLTGLMLSQPGTDIRAERLVLEWQPAALLQGRLIIEQLTLEGVHADLTALAEESTNEPFRPSTLSVPLDIQIRQATLDKLQVLQEGEPIAVIDHLALQASLENNTLEVAMLEAQLPGASIKAQGSTALADQMPLSWDLEWAYQLPAADGTVPLAGSASLSGDLGWDERLDFALNYGLTARGLEQVLPELPDQLAARGVLNGSQDAKTLRFDQISLGFANLPMRLQLSGSLEGLDQALPELALQATWQDLQWPPTADMPLAASGVGSLGLVGTPQSYDLTMEAAVSGDGVPPSQWRLAGIGNTESLQLEHLHGQLLEGELATSGQLAWAPEPSWNLAIQGKGLNPESMADGLTGNLSLTLHTRGALAGGESLQAEIALAQLSGMALGYPIQAQGLFELAGDVISIQQLQAQSGANQLEASGTLDPEQLALAWSLRAADPDLLLEGASGLLAGDGTISGSLDQPQLRARLASEQLRVDGTHIEDLKLSLQAGTTPKAPLTLMLSASSPATAEDTAPIALTLALGGTNEQHAAQLEVQSGEQRLTAAMNGGLDQQLTAWKGSLDELALHAASLGHWRLQQPAHIDASAESAKLERICLTRTREHGKARSDPSKKAGATPGRATPGRATPGRACAQLAWQAGGESSASVELADLPLRLLVADIRSRIDGALEAHLTTEGELRATGEMSFSPGELKLDTGDTRFLAHGGGALTLNIDEQGLRATLGLDTPEQGRVDARVTLPAMHSLPLPERQPLEGTLEANIPELSGLASWFEELEASQGSLAMDFDLGGTLEKPRLAGRLALQDAGADIPLAGLQLQQVNLEARSDPRSPQRMIISGGARSGPGSLAVNGEANLDDLSVQIALKGERFLAYDTVDARALISPDLQVNWQDQLLLLRGRLEIPEASLTPQLQLGSNAAGAETAEPGAAVAPSTDVVILHGPESVQTESSPLKVDSKIEIVLGRDVDVNALGFASRLPGEVTLSSAPGQSDLIPSARGQLAIEDGTFRAFGQDLDIESGQIIFAGGPATEPELNLRAVRWIDNDPAVTAVGVIVTGPAAAPTLTLFSRPQLDPGEIQSYLLTGRSPNNRESVLSIGTYVTPRLYVGYGYNLLQNTNEFNSLFSITPRLGVGGNFGEADNNLNMTVTYER